MTNIPTLPCGFSPVWGFTQQVSGVKVQACTATGLSVTPLGPQKI